MPKELTQIQLEQILGKKQSPAAPLKPEEYDPALDDSMEAFFNKIGKPAHYDYDNPWPPRSHPATDLYLRMNGVSLLGAGEHNVPELPAFLSCLQRTRSELVREKALRCVLYVLDEFTDKVTPELVTEGVAAIEAHPQLHDEYTAKFLSRIKGETCPK